MARLRVLAFALALAFAVPGAAEPGPPETNASTLTGRFGGDAPFHVERRGFSFPIIDYVEPTGERQQRRGIIAGKTIARDTLLGLGLFETTVRSRPMIGDPAGGNSQRRGRKSAAIGLKMKF